MLFALLAASAHASSGQRILFQDNAQMLGSPDATAQELKGLGVDIVKMQLLWDDVAPAGRHKPAGFDASDPASYHWNTYPGAVRAIVANGMQPYLSPGPGARMPRSSRCSRRRSGASSRTSTSGRSGTSRTCTRG